MLAGGETRIAIFSVRLISRVTDYTPGVNCYDADL